MKTGTCKLCLESKPLLKKSHIIPSFMYQNVFTKGEKMHVFSPTKIALGKAQRTRFALTGAYDKDILCEECDNVVIGKYETYASKVIYAKPGQIDVEIAPVVKNYEIDSEMRFGECTNIDYAKFKLFLLSILWRASISNHTLFDYVDLGPHEETIRKMIFDGDPKESFDYPIVQLYFRNSKMPAMIGQPKRSRIRSTGMTVYHFIIDKSIFLFIIGNSYHRATEAIHEFSISPKNEMKIVYLEGMRGLDVLFRHFNVKL